MIADLDLDLLTRGGDVIRQSRLVAVTHRFRVNPFRGLRRTGTDGEDPRLMGTLSHAAADVDRNGDLPLGGSGLGAHAHRRIPFELLVRIHAGVQHLLLSQLPRRRTGLGSDVEHRRSPARLVPGRAAAWLKFLQGARQDENFRQTAVRVPNVRHSLAKVCRHGFIRVPICLIVLSVLASAHDDPLGSPSDEGAFNRRDLSSEIDLVKGINSVEAADDLQTVWEINVAQICRLLERTASQSLEALRQVE